MLNFPHDHDVLISLQSVFFPGDSTVNQLVDMYNSYCKSLDEGKEVHAVFCNISKAFDRFWHRGILYKLQTVGIIGSLLMCFKDYLKDQN